MHDAKLFPWSSRFLDCPADPGLSCSVFCKLERRCRFTASSPILRWGSLALKQTVGALFEALPTPGRIIQRGNRFVRGGAWEAKRTGQTQHFLFIP